MLQLVEGINGLGLLIGIEVDANKHKNTILSNHQNFSPKKSIGVDYATVNLSHIRDYVNIEL